MLRESIVLVRLSVIALHSREGRTDLLLVYLGAIRIVLVVDIQMLKTSFQCASSHDADETRCSHRESNIRRS